MRRNFLEISDKGSRLISRDPHKRYALRRPVTLDARTTQEIRPRKGRDGRKKKREKRRKKEERRRGGGGYAETHTPTRVRIVCGCAGETIDQREPGSEETNSERGDEAEGTERIPLLARKKKKESEGKQCPASGF